MKKILVLLLVFLSVKVVGQVEPGKDETGTGVKVVHTKKPVVNKGVMYYLNGEILHESLLATLNTESLTDVDVKNNQVFLTTKDNYKPQILSLNELKRKYDLSEQKPVLFLINGVLINRDYDSFFVDENFLLTISTENVQNTREGLDLIYINLLTKSKDNISKSKAIMIRGNDL